MRIGFTYDLKEDYRDEGLDPELLAELDCSDTIDGIESQLRGMGFIVDRIGNIKALASRLARGDRWPLVFNIAEGLHGPLRESHVPALLDAYEIPYVFSDAAVLMVALDKGLAKLILQAHNIPTPAFAVVHENADIYSVDLPYPLFAKPLTEGSGKGITPESKIEDRAQLERICRGLLDRFAQPVLVERFLPGREFTVGMLGTGTDTRVIGIMEIAIDPEKDTGYGYHNKTDWMDHISYQMLDAGKQPALMEELTNISIAAWNALGCRDGGRLDIRCDAAGIPNVLEINPLAGLRPDFSDLVVLARCAGMDYDVLISSMVDSSLKRCGLTRPIPKIRRSEIPYHRHRLPASNVSATGDRR